MTRSDANAESFRQSLEARLRRLAAERHVQIGGWLRQGGVEDPQTMRDRFAGLRRYAEAMEDTALLREIERVVAEG